MAVSGKEITEEEFAAVEDIDEIDGNSDCKERCVGAIVTLIRSLLSSDSIVPCSPDAKWKFSTLLLEIGTDLAIVCCDMLRFFMLFGVTFVDPAIFDGISVDFACNAIVSDNDVDVAIVIDGDIDENNEDKVSNAVNVVEFNKLRPFSIRKTKVINWITVIFIGSFCVFHWYSTV